MLPDTYNPTSSAQYAEQSSIAADTLPDERTGVFILQLG